MTTQQKWLWAAMIAAAFICKFTGDHVGFDVWLCGAALFAAICGIRG